MNTLVEKNVGSLDEKLISGNIGALKWRHPGRILLVRKLGLDSLFYEFP